jgi:hypothetical protein
MCSQHLDDAGEIGADPSNSRASRTQWSLLVLLLALAVSHIWKFSTAASAIDYYHFWAVADYVRTRSPTNVYADQIRRDIADVTQHEFMVSVSHDTPPRHVLRAHGGISHWNGIHTYSTPFLYAVIGWLSTKGTDASALLEFNRSLDLFQALSWLVLLAAIGLFCRRLQYEPSRLCLLLVLTMLGFEPVLSDMQVGNVQRLQGGVLILAFLGLTGRGSAPLRFGSAALLGAAIAFKPNAAPIALFIALGWCGARQWPRLVRFALAVSSGAALAAISSSVWFGSSDCWFHWLDAVTALVVHTPDLAEANDPALAVTGNCSLVAALSPAIGSTLSSLAPLVLLAALSIGAVAVGWNHGARTVDSSPDCGTDRRSTASHQTDLDVCTFAIGMAATPLVGRLTWVHYFTMTLPLVAVALRPGARSAAWTPTRQCARVLAVLLLARLTWRNMLLEPLSDAVTAWLMCGAAIWLAFDVWRSAGSRQNARARSTPSGPLIPSGASVPAHLRAALGVMATPTLLWGACWATFRAAEGLAASVQGVYRTREADVLYLLWDAPVTLYLRAPLTSAALIAIFLAPGVLLNHAWRQRPVGVESVALGLVTSVALLLPLPAIGVFVQSFGASFSVGGIWTGVGVGAALVAALRSRTATVSMRALAAGSWRALRAPLAVCVVCITVAAPKIYWESFNGDGAHAMESARLLLRQPFPFWEVEAGAVSTFPAFNSALFAFPSWWFLGALGDSEAAVRLPTVLYLLGAFLAARAVAERGRSGALGRLQASLLGAGLLSCGFVMAYSGTYDPYCSDLALPASQDALLLFLTLCLVLATERRSRAAVALITLLMFTTSPGGALLAGAWFIGAGVCASTLRSRALAVGVATLLLSITGIRGLELALPSAVQGWASGEHSLGSLAAKFAQLDLSNGRRLVWMIAPTGVYSLWCLVRWRQLDPLSRALFVAVGLPFAAYYSLAHASVHYFTPLMFLPLVAFWRSAERLGARLHGAGVGLRATVLSGCAISGLALSLPSEFTVHTASREVGERMIVRGFEGYWQSKPIPFRATELMAAAFPLDSDLRVPEQMYGGSPLAWNYYARRSSRSERERVFVLQNVRHGRPPGQLVAVSEIAALSVLDAAAWRSMATASPASSCGHPLYAVSRETLFGRRGSVHARER